MLKMSRMDISANENNHKMKSERKRKENKQTSVK
jgi:hypothetical protein